MAERADEAIDRYGPAREVGSVRLTWLACGSLAACVVAGCVVAPRVQTATNEPEVPRLEQELAVMPDGARLPLRAWLPSAALPSAGRLPGATLPSTGQPSTGPPSAAAAPARGVILAVHGLGDHAGSFDATGSFLADQGFAVYAFDQRGFGRTAQPGIWAGSDRMADDVHEVARLLRLRYPGARLYGLGESMGGAVLLHALHRHPPGWIDGAALLAPAVWSRAVLPWYSRAPLRVLAHSWRGMKLSGRITGRVPTDDAQALRQRHEDPLVIQRHRVDVLWGLADLMDAATSKAAPAAVPVLILYGAHDQIVPPQATCAWIQGLSPNGGWQLAFYPEGWHLLTRDRDAPTALGDLAAWFTRPGMGLPSGADDAMPVERLCAQPTTRSENDAR